MLGKPTTEELKARTTDDKALLDNIEAVNKTLEYFRSNNKEHVIKAIESVYFFCPKRAWRKKELTERVIFFSLSYGASERTVFYWLKEARDVFSELRGLKIKSESFESLQL